MFCLLWPECSLSNPYSNSPRKPAERLRGEGEEKVCPAYEKTPRPFHRLRAFSELAEGLTFEPRFKPVRESSGANRGRKGGAAAWVRSDF